MNAFGEQGIHKHEPHICVQGTIKYGRTDQAAIRQTEHRQGRIYRTNQGAAARWSQLTGENMVFVDGEDAVTSGLFKVAGHVILQ